MCFLKLRLERGRELWMDLNGTDSIFVARFKYNQLSTNKQLHYQNSICDEGSSSLSLTPEPFVSR